KYRGLSDNRIGVQVNDLVVSIRVLQREESTVRAEIEVQSRPPNTAANPLATIGNLDEREPVCAGPIGQITQMKCQSPAVGQRHRGLVRFMDRPATPKLLPACEFLDNVTTCGILDHQSTPVAR